MCSGYEVRVKLIHDNGTQEMWRYEEEPTGELRCVLLPQLHSYLCTVGNDLKLRTRSMQVGVTSPLLETNVRHHWFVRHHHELIYAVLVQGGGEWSTYIDRKRVPHPDALHLHACSVWRATL